MKKTLLAAFGILFWSSVAQAQWSGGYVGAVGGLGSGTASQRTTPLAPPPPPPVIITDHDYRISGGTFGGGLGYDFQTGPWVLGGLADFSWANLRGSTA